MGQRHSKFTRKLRIAPEGSARNCSHPRGKTIEILPSGLGAGFTLIEILISMAIMFIIAGAFVVFNRDLFSVNQFLQESLSIQRDSEAVIRDIVQELRSAQQSSAGGYAIEIAGDNSLAFYVNVDKEPLRERIHYFLEGNSLRKSVVRPAGQPLTYSTTTAQESVKTALRNIISTTTPMFAYYDSTYAGTTTPLAQPVSIPLISLVGITITVDENAARLPPPVTVSSQVTVRILRTNL